MIQVTVNGHMDTANMIASNMSRPAKCSRMLRQAKRLEREIDALIRIGNESDLVWLISEFRRYGLPGKMERRAAMLRSTNPKAEPGMPEVHALKMERIRIQNTANADALDTIRLKIFGQTVLAEPAK